MCWVGTDTLMCLSIPSHVAEFSYGCNPTQIHKLIQILWDCFCGLTAWLLHVDFAVTAMLGCQKVGCACCGSDPLHPVGIQAFSLPAAICSGHLGLPIAGYRNSVRPNHYTQLPNHIHLPHILSHARLAFNELAQIEAFRNLLIFFLELGYSCSVLKYSKGWYAANEQCLYRSVG